MKSVFRALLAITITVLSGCAPFVGSCDWVVPEAGEAMKTVAARKPAYGECNCIRCGAPGRFRLERAHYTLEFWNGDQWHAQLYVRARATDGSMLTLTSSPEVVIPMGPGTPVAATHGYDYFVRPETMDSKDFPRSLSINVLQPDGQVLGTEAIGLRVESRKDMSIEYL